MTKWILTFFLSITVLMSYSQTKAFTSRDSLNAYCDKVMQTFVEGNFSKGIQLFKQNSVMDTATVNGIDITMNEQMTNIMPVYKKLVGYELIEEKAIKNSIARRRYLLKFENYFLTFDFILYNNGTGWTVSNFNYKDEPKELF